jgi:tRNA threonylcarbamoyladenosine biosynthesis protein TsaE
MRSLTVAKARDDVSSTVSPVQGSFNSDSAAETEAIGAQLAASLHPGDVVLIEGELGAGKTTLVRGAARALGVQGPVTSPTFTIGQRYPARVPVAHVDLYRVANLADEVPDLLADYLGPDTIAFVEWPQDDATLAGLAAIVARVRLEHRGGDRRRISIGAHAGSAA